MSDLLADFESYFISKGVATVVYKDTAPTQPDSVTSLYEYEGISFIPQVEGAIRSIQFVVRDRSAANAKRKAQELYKTLITEDGILNLTEDRWTVVALRQPPFRMKADEAGRIYYAFNASVTTYID